MEKPSARTDRKRHRASFPESYLLDDEPSIMSEAGSEHTHPVRMASIALGSVILAGTLALSGAGSRFLAFLAH